MLRKLVASDAAPLHALCAAVGWPHREADLALLLSLGDGVAACAPDGAMLGTAMRWRWSADCACMGMVLVAPAQQGRGMGRHMMQALLDEAPAQAVMLNATEAGLGLYERLGFRPIGVVCQHQGIVAAPPAAPALRRAEPQDLPALVALDAAAFGVARGALIARLLADAEIRVIERGGRPCGFAARRDFGRGDAIGPLIAETEDDAIMLATCLLRPGFQRIDIPVRAKALAAWATGAGLIAVDSVTVMTRGDWPQPGATPRRFALASQTLG